ncbi:MAG TPA: PAS domain S-box protein, partial [Terrimicrobiaceae bacterium]
AEGLLSAANENVRLQIDQQALEARTASEELNAEVQAMSQLHDFSFRLLAPSEHQLLFEEILGSMMMLQKAELGLLHLYRPDDGTLELAAHRGFEDDSLNLFQNILEDRSGVDRAFDHGESVLIEETDEAFGPYRALAELAEFRALEFTPLTIDPAKVLGVITTFFRQSYRPSQRELRLTRLCAQQAARAIERENGEQTKKGDDLRLQRLFEGMNEYALFMLDAAGRVVLWSKSAEHVEGRDSKKILGKHFSTLYELSDIQLQKPGEALRVAAEEGRSEDDFLRIRADGRRSWTNVVLKALKDNFGTIDGFVAVSRDITQRKETEEELGRALSYLAEAQKLSKTGSWGWDSPAGEMFWSKETFRIFGVNPRDVKASYQLLLQFVHPDDRALVEETLESARRDGREFKIDFRIILANGSIKHLRSLGLPASEESDLVGWVGAMIDVTDQKVSEEAFRKVREGLALVTQLTLREFAASIAQQVDPPLEAIAKNGNFCVRLAEATHASPYEAREALVEIVREVDSLGAIIARAQTKIPEKIPTIVALDLGELVFKVLAIAAEDLKQNRITVETHVAEDLPQVSGDRSQIEQALLNLVINAIEAMSAESDERRLLTIAAESDHLDDRGVVRIIVKDCGPGLNPETMDRLFEAFFTTKPNHLGMGLRITRTVIETHGGLVSASVGASPGATFTCVLPLSVES